MKQIAFDAVAFAQFAEWAALDRKLHQRIARLLTEAARTPFEGTGKPEPLRANLVGCWSWRITDEHRLVYKVNDEQILVLSCRGHYE